jgi:hypothetical protein
MWHDTMDMPHVDFVAITAAYNWEPYLALMPVTATEGDLAAGDMSVDTGGEFLKPMFRVSKDDVKSRRLRPPSQFATSISVGAGPMRVKSAIVNVVRLQRG